MTRVITALLSTVLLAASLTALAVTGPLDGQKYCRSVETGGMFGQPTGKRGHCVSFKDGIATDNANTFFGNPAAHYQYRIEGRTLVNSDRNQPTSYDIEGETLVMRETGAILTRQESEKAASPRLPDGNYILQLSDQSASIARPQPISACTVVSEMEVRGASTTSFLVHLRNRYAAECPGGKPVLQNDRYYVLHRDSDFLCGVSYSSHDLPTDCHGSCHSVYLNDYSHAPTICRNPDDGRPPIAADLTLQESLDGEVVSWVAYPSSSR